MAALEEASARQNILPFSKFSVSSSQKAILGEAVATAPT